MSLAADVLYDHEVLRGKLALLEELLPSRYVAPYTVTRLVESIIAALRRHAEEGERAAQALTPESAERVREEHRRLQARAALLLELVSPAAAIDEEHAVTHIRYFLSDLRRHLTEEETMAGVNRAEPERRQPASGDMGGGRWH
ncbi:MAG: hypothetical protein HYT90_00780 [Candidatus Omnitrophica bacterium]|nr:hypothetical protein [Candidatus Omnitrophota bacterium]